MSDEIVLADIEKMTNVFNEFVEWEFDKLQINDIFRFTDENDTRKHKLNVVCSETKLNNEGIGYVECETLIPSGNFNGYYEFKGREKPENYNDGLIKIGNFIFYVEEVYEKSLIVEYAENQETVLAQFIAGQAYQIIGTLAEDEKFNTPEVIKVLDYFSGVSNGNISGYEWVLPFSIPMKDKLDE